MFYDFITKYIDIFCWKMREAFKMQKFLTFSQLKILAYLNSAINVWNFNETLTNDVVSLEHIDKSEIILKTSPWNQKIWRKCLPNSDN